MFRDAQFCISTEYIAKRIRVQGGKMDKLRQAGTKKVKSRKVTFNWQQNEKFGIFG
jgi:hypothetical protein